MKPIVLLLIVLVAALSLVAMIADAASPQRTLGQQGQGVARVPRHQQLKGKRAKEARANIQRDEEARKRTVAAKKGGEVPVAASAAGRSMKAAGLKKKAGSSFAAKKAAAARSARAAALEDLTELSPDAVKRFITDPRDKLARTVPRMKGPSRRFARRGDGDDGDDDDTDRNEDAPPGPNPWYHGADSLGYKPYGHTTITNWNVPPLAGAGAFAYFRSVQMMVRVDNDFVAYINTTTGEVLSTPALDCLIPQHVIRANATIGYYSCADGTIALFDVLRQRTLSTFQLPATNQGFNNTDYPYLYDDEEVVFEFIPHLQQNMLLLQVQNYDTNLEAAQVVILNDAGAVTGFGPILNAECGQVSFVGLTQQASTEALSAVMVCSTGHYYAFPDPSVSSTVGFKWATDSILFRSSPNIESLPYAPGHTGPKTYFIKSIAFAYLDEANPAGNLFATEVYTDNSEKVITRNDIPRQTGNCGNLNRNAMQGPAMVLGNVFLFTTVCGMFGYNLNTQEVLYSSAAGADMQFKNLFWGGAGEGATTVGVLVKSVVDESNVVSVFDIITGNFLYRNQYKMEITGIAHANTNVIYKPPGFARPLDAEPISTIVVLTSDKMSVVNVKTGLVITTVPLLVSALMPPVYLPESDSIVVIGTDHSIISYGTAFGMAYFTDTTPTIHEGVVYASGVAEDYNAYIFAIDQAGRVMWGSERSFGSSVRTFGIHNRYVMAIEGPVITFLDMYTGATVDIIEINTNCEVLEPRMPGGVTNIVQSKDGRNIYFTAGTKCMYNIGPDLTLSGFVMPFRTSNVPVIDNLNNYVFAFEGYNVVALDMNNFGEVLWSRDLDNAPLAIVPASASVNTDVFPGYKPEFVYVLCEFGLYALYYPRDGATMWSYLVRNGSMTNKVVTNLLIFNQAAYIKYGNTVAKITLDPTVAYDNRIMWTAPAHNEEVVEQTGSERLIATASGMIIWVGGNDIKVFDSTTGQTYIDRTDSCAAPYGSILSYDAYMNALAVSCSNTIVLYNMTTGNEIFGMLNLPAAKAVSLRDGVLISASADRVFIQAMPPRLLPHMDYFKPLPTIAPARTFAPLPDDASPIPAPTLAPPTFGGIYNAPPPFVANMTTNTIINELKWNKIFTVKNGDTSVIIAQDGFTFAEDWAYTAAGECGIKLVRLVGDTLLNGVILISCEQLPNRPAGKSMLYAVSAKTGQLVWSVPDMSPRNYYLVEGSTTVVVSYDSNKLAALSLGTGDRIWEREMDLEPTAVVIMGLSTEDKKASTDYLIYADAMSNLTALSIVDGTTVTSIDDACYELSPVLVSGQQVTTYVQRNLSHFYYMCDEDLKRWDIVTGTSEAILTFEAPDTLMGIYFTTNNMVDTPLLMVALPRHFDIYTVEGQMTKTFSFEAREGCKFFGTSAYLAEKKLAIAAYGNVETHNVNFVAINVADSANNELAWDNWAGSYNYLVMSKAMSSATMLPDDSGNFVLLNGGVFVMSSVNGNVNTQFQGEFVAASFPNVAQQTFIEGPDLITQTQTRIVVGSERMAALIIVDPMIDNSPDAYGWSFSGMNSAKGFESYTDCVTKEHFTVVFDDDGIAAQIDDAGYVKWVTNGLDDNAAPLNIFAVAYVSGDAAADPAHPNGYIALISDHGVTFVSALDGSFIVELHDILQAGITVIPDIIQYLAWGDSVYVTSYDFLFRFDPFARKMTYLRVATYPLQYISKIGAISLDGTMIVLNTNLGSIVAVNTTDMWTAVSAAFTGLGSPVSGFAPACANRTAAPRGTSNPEYDYFITYSADTATFTYLRFSDLMVMQMMNEAPSAIFTTTDDCHLLLWSEWVISKYSNELVTGGYLEPLWTVEVVFEGATAEDEHVQFAHMSNIGVVSLSGINGEYFTFNYETGAQLAHFMLDGIEVVYDTFFTVAGQGVHTPMVADAIFVDTDYGGIFVRATNGEIISQVLDMNLHIVAPTTPTVTYLYVEFGTLLTISPVPLAATPIDPALGLKPIPTRHLQIPADYEYNFDPVITERFEPEYTNASFAMRIWAEPGFNQSTVGYRYIGSFVVPYNERPAIAALVAIHGNGYLQFRDALSGASLAADVPVDYDATQQARWIGRLSGSVGAYCSHGNKLVGFSLSDLSIADKKLFSTQLPSSVLVNPPYPHSDTPNVPIMNLRGDDVTCMLLTDSRAVCVDSKADSPTLGHILVNFMCPKGSDHYAPPFVDPTINVVVFSCMAKSEDQQTFVMTAYDVTNPTAPKWTFTDNSNNVAGVDGTTNFMVVFVSTPDRSSGAYTIAYASGEKVSELLEPNVIMVSAMDGWEQDIVYAIFVGRNADNWDELVIVGLDLTNGKRLWRQAPPEEVPVEGEWDATAVISSLDQTYSNWVAVIVFNTGAVCSFDVDTGVKDWCVTTELATTAQFVELYEDGFLLWGQVDTNLVEFRNLADPRKTWFLSTNNDFSDLAHSLYMFDFQGVTFIHRAFSTRLAAYAVQTEPSAIFPNYVVADSLSNRFIVLSNSADATMAVYDSVDDYLLWGVKFFSRAEIQMRINPAIYAPNGVPKTVLVAYTDDAVMGLSAVDGSLEFVVSLPFCNSGLSPIQSAHWDEVNGYLYIGYDTCVVSISAADGTFYQNDVGAFVGKSIALTENCLIVVSLFGDVTCYSRPVDGVFDINPVWIDSVGLYTTDFDIKEYGAYLLFIWTDNQVMMSEKTGQRVFERNTRDVGVEVQVWSNYLVLASDEGITVLDIAIDTPAEKRQLANWHADVLVPAPFSDNYLSPSRPVITPWGLAVAEVRQRIFGIDLATMRIVWNQTSYSTLESLKSTPCDYKYVEPDASVAAGDIQRQVLVCDGNTYSAITGATFTQAPPLTFTFANKGTLFPNGQTVSEYVIAGYSEGTYISELPFSYLKLVAKEPIPTAFPTSPHPTGTLHPDFTPQTQFAPYPVLPDGITLPDHGCVYAITNQRRLYDTCIEQIILLQQRANTFGSAKCADIATEVTRCADEWISGIPPACPASTQYLQVAAKAARASPAFPWCATAGSCADGQSAAVCAALDKTEAHNKAGTPHPVATIPAPAGLPPVFSSVPAPTMPAETYKYFRFHAIAFQGSERQTVEGLAERLQAILELADLPALVIGNFSTASTFDFSFADENVAFDHSSVLARRITDAYGQTAADLGLVMVSFTPYGPVDPPTPAPTTSAVSTTAPTTTHAPYTTSASMDFYRFHCLTAEGGVPSDLAESIGRLLNLNYDPDVRIVMEDMDSFDFEFTNYYAAGTLSPRLNGLIVDDAERVQYALNVLEISGYAYDPEVPTTLPPAPEDADDVRPALSGPAVAGLVILVLVGVAVGGLLVYVFVIKRSTSGRRDENDAASIVEPMTEAV